MGAEIDNNTNSVLLRQHFHVLHADVMVAYRVSYVYKDVILTIRRNSLQKLVQILYTIFGASRIARCSLYREENIVYTCTYSMQPGSIHIVYTLGAVPFCRTVHMTFIAASSLYGH